MTTPPVVASIAATDSGGAAGLAADLATFAALGAHGACVVTAITAQDTTGVRAIHQTPLEMLDEQLDAVLDDLPVAAVKTGLLGSAEAVHWLADRVARLRVRPAGGPPVVVDPVLRATSGVAFGDTGVLAAYREHLLPVVDVVTPNAGEARALLGLGSDDATPPEALAGRLSALGPAVVVTGGPEPEVAGETCTDWLAANGETFAFTHAAITTTNDHGTGCTFSAALAVSLARGAPLADAVRRAAHHTTRRLALSRHWDLGRGRGPIGHTTTHTGDEK